MFSHPTLSIHLTNPRPSYIPDDTLTGNVLLKTPPTSSLDLTSLGITFLSTESLRYNSVRNETILFNYPQTLFQGPYTLRENQEYVYPFEFEVPGTTDPPGPEGKIFRPATMGAGDLYESEINHRLPPSTEHNRPGISYSFDAEIKYELYAWVMKKRWLGSGEKVSVECREEVKILPTDRESEGLVERCLNYRHVEMVRVGGSGEGEKGGNVGEEEVEEEQHGRFSKLLSSKKKDPSPSSSSAPTETLELNIQTPHILLRNHPNPITLTATYPPSLQQPSPPYSSLIKLHSLTIDLKSTLHVPCLERTVYGAKPGISEEIQTLTLLSEDDYHSPLRIPPGDEEREPLSIPLFPTPQHHLPMYTFDFKTFKIARTHSLSFKARVECGGEGFVVEMRDLELVVPFPASRAPEADGEEERREEVEADGSGSGGERKAAWEEKGKGREVEAEADRGEEGWDEPPPMYKG